MPFHVQALYPDAISNSRGVGTFCAVDFPSKRQRDDVIVKLMNKSVDTVIKYQYIVVISWYVCMSGVYAVGCSNRTIRTRPSLIFQPRHAHFFLDILESVIG